MWLIPSSIFCRYFFRCTYKHSFFFVRWKSIFNFFCCLLSCAPCEREIKSERENAHFTVNAYICLYKLTNIIFNVCTLNEWSRSVDWNKKLKQCVIVRQIFYLKVEFSCFFYFLYFLGWSCLILLSWCFIETIFEVLVFISIAIKNT